MDARHRPSAAAHGTRSAASKCLKSRTPRSIRRLDRATATSKTRPMVSVARLSPPHPSDRYADRVDMKTNLENIGASDLQRMMKQQNRLFSEGE